MLRGGPTGISIRFWKRRPRVFNSLIPIKARLPEKTFEGISRASKKEVGQSGETFMDLSGIVAYESGGALVACCTWKTRVYKNIVGNGLIIVGDDEVQREDVVLT